MAPLSALGLRLFAAERSRGHTKTIAFGARAESRAMTQRFNTSFKAFSLLPRRLCGFQKNEKQKQNEKQNENENENECLHPWSPILRPQTPDPRPQSPVPSPQSPVLSPQSPVPSPQSSPLSLLLLPFRRRKQNVI